MKSVFLLFNFLKVISYILLFLLSFGELYSAKLSLFMDNDFPFDTDRYYTHGWGIKYTSEKLNSSELLQSITFFESIIHSQISINQKIYTPKNTTATEYLNNDFPYSGLLYFKLATIGKNDKDFFLITNYSIGIIGKNAYGKETQEAIHSVSASALNPKGWQNQLNNDLILNLDMILQKKIFDIPAFRIDASALAGFGTLNNYLGIGLSLNKNIVISKNMDIIFNISDNIYASIYDSRLRGTFLINPSKALPAKEIQPFYNTLELSSFIRLYNFEFVFSVLNLSKRIKEGNMHNYISLEFGYRY